MRRKQTIRAISLIVMVCFLTVSCATMAENPALCTLAGGLLGGGIGAGLGALAGGKKGAATGAMAGGAVGALLAAAYCFKAGPFASREVKGYEETRSATNYQADQGDVIQITRYSLTPAATAPGKVVVLNATYSVMAPNPNQEVPIIETRILKRLNPATKTYEVLGQVETPVTVKPGTRQADGSFPVPSGTPDGQYVVVLAVTKDRQRDMKELPLIVTKDQAVLQQSSSRMAETVAPSGKAGTVSSSSSGASQTAVPVLSPAPLLSQQQAMAQGRCSLLSIEKKFPQGSQAWQDCLEAELAKARVETAQQAEQSAPQAPQVASVPTQKSEAQAGPASTIQGTPLAAIGEQDPKAPLQVASVPAAGREVPKTATEKARYFVASKVSGKGTVREGPGANHKSVGEIAEKDRYPIIEETKNPRGVWYKIRLDSGTEGWVAASLGIIEVQE